MNEVKQKREDFINQYPPLNLLNKQDIGKIWAEEDFHLYVHIPYCIKKCDFCYYVSYENKNGQIPEEYLEALKKEIRLYGGMEQFKNRKVRSIYWGGGTPTLMSLSQIKDLLEVIWESFQIHEDVEFCCEVRPGPETTKEKIMLMKEYGLKRVSIGCQSLNDNVLKLNGRNHNSNTFYKTFNMVRECDVFSINVDLMSGLLGDTQETFLYSIDEMIKLRPENLTIYKLEVYLNNLLYKKTLGQEARFITDEEEAEHVEAAYNRLLENGYLLSDNYSFCSEDKYRQIHRYNTWEGEDMIGVGLSSHSCYGLTIYQNDNRMADYMEQLQNDKLPIRRAYEFSVYEDMVRMIIFGIKSVSYPLEKFSRKFGIGADVIFADKLSYLQKEGYIDIKDGILNTTLKGALYADDVVRIFYPDRYRDAVLAHKARG
ncbi:coproporphyrinogen-III oxidase family protein [Anaerocolumna sp. AGMB13020]|uniref:coproporphyrinogen-III oxidase family protein n=1 Tax=Anaerocolumna sp. AGMB13020 TaxID=3081750 RepID=UPI00295478EC|nr:coproporphyrinogen-III oxidase family protein [Anaerocolumna sp. AGMB13020]WOO34822.1 coproporphyrinogen-III oxidase family protein [Anaerocolumna sp. AGMB13020]